MYFYEAAVCPECGLESDFYIWIPDTPFPDCSIFIFSHEYASRRPVCWWGVRDPYWPILYRWNPEAYAWTA